MRAKLIKVKIPDERHQLMPVRARLVQGAAPGLLRPKLVSRQALVPALHRRIRCIRLSFNKVGRMEKLSPSAVPAIALATAGATEQIF